MAEALTGQAQAKQILADLNQRHYFTQKHESHPVFYQYHPLFREFLQTRGRERFNITELSEIKNRASVIMAENGQIEDAVTLMVKSENWFALIPMILSHAPALISHGRNQTLDTWIQSLPPPQIQENPWLLYWLGVCRLPFSPLESGGLFEEAFNSFRTGKDAAGIYLSLAGLFDSTTYGMGDFKAYDRWPWPLKVFTLGTFDLVKEGESLEFPVKAPRKMFSFLKVLVASGGKGLSEEQLTEALWPEADGNMAHQAFATTLHRLRQLLGDEKAIHLRKGILKFDEGYCYVDAHAFEYLVQQAAML